MLSREVLEKAMTMEEETRDYYLRAKEQSTQYTVKQFLGLIALEEEAHVEEVRKLFEKLEGRRDWGEIRPVLTSQRPFAEILEDFKGERPPEVDAAEKEGEVLEKAIAMEEAGERFYRELGASLTGEGERAFFFTLADQEKKHQETFANLYRWLRDPHDMW
jgi:rubrerythrin